MAESLKSQWQDFDENALRNANADTSFDREVVRLAFYSGAVAMYAMIAATGDDDVSEADGIAVMERLADEIKMFGETLGT